MDYVRKVIGIIKGASRSSGYSSKVNRGFRSIVIYGKFLNPKHLRIHI